MIFILDKAPKKAAPPKKPPRKPSSPKMGAP